jgi:anti-anti-sigma regulatory factor
LFIIFRLIWPRRSVKYKPHHSLALFSTRGDINFFAGPVITEQYVDIEEHFRKDGCYNHVVVDLDQVIHVDVDAARAFFAGIQNIQKVQPDVTVTYVGCKTMVRKRIEENHADSVPCEFVDTLEEALSYKSVDSFEPPMKPPLPYVAIADAPGDPGCAPEK